MSQESAFYIEQLSLGSLMRILKKGRRAQIHYFDKTRYSGRLALGLSKCLRMSASQVSFRMVDVKSADGEIENLVVIYSDLADLHQTVADQINAKLDVTTTPREFRLYCLKSANSIGSVSKHTFHRAAYILKVAQWHHTSAKPFAIQLMARDWNLGIDRLIQRTSIEKVLFYKMPLPNFKWFKTTAMSLLGRRALWLWKGKRWMTELRLPDSVSWPQPSAGGSRISYSSDGDTFSDSRTTNNEAFFTLDGTIEKNRLVVFIDRSILKAKHSIDQKENASIQFVATEPQFAGELNIPLLRYKPGRHLPLKNSFYGQTSSFWHRTRGIEYETLYDKWYQYFKQMNIKVHVDWMKYAPYHVPRSAAIRDLGGFSLMYQRAYEEFPTPENGAFCDAMLFWNPMALKATQDSAPQISYGFVTGYSKDYCFAPLKKQAGSIRKGLQAKGAQFIAAYFDEGSAPDDRWHTGHSFTRENYAYLINKVLQEPWFGLVIKPKVPVTLWERLGPVAELLKEGLDTGRIHIYQDSFNVFSSVPPVAASFEADVTIHGHLCAASAGVESALAGQPTLFYDGEGWGRSCLHQLGPRLACTTRDQMWESLVAARSGDKELWKPWQELLPILDPYRDGRGYQRFTAMTRLLASIPDGVSREDYLDDIAEQWRKDWGSDKVVRL